MPENLERELLVARAAESGQLLRSKLAVLDEHLNMVEDRGLGLLWASSS